MYLEQDTFARTIGIPTLGVGTTQFELPRDRAEALYESGRDAAAKFIERWNFDAYIREYREGKTHSRREQIAQQLQKEATVAG